MRCHKCNQESINIDNGHIICDICGLDIDVSLNLEEDNFFDLFFYNKNLEEAEKLGHEAMQGDKEIGDNPYSVDNNQIILNKRWEEGYNAEKLSYEYSALSLSAEKIETDLRTKIRILTEEKELLEGKIEKFIPPNCKYIEYFCSDLLNTKIIGKLIRKKVIAFRDKYKAFHRDTLGTWKHPD
jgi:hypothetical protein